MKSLLSKFLQVRSHEASSFVCSFLILFFIGVAATIGLAVTEALFLKEIGSAWLPQMMVVNSVIILVAFPVYDRLTRKLSPDNTFYLLTALFGAVIAVCGLILLLPSPPRAIYVLLLPLFALFYAMFYAQFSNYMAHFFDPMQSKRLLPTIFCATTLGMITGGTLVHSLIRFGSFLLFFVWAVTLLCVALFIRINRANRTAQHVSLHDDDHGTITDELRAAVKMVRESKFIRLSLFFAFLCHVLVSANEVVSSTVFAAMPRFADSESLIAFYGKLEGVMGGIALVVQLVIIPFMIRHFGIGPVAIITPLLQLLAFAGLTFGSSGLLFAFAILARFNVAASCDYVDPIAQNLLLNALSPRQKSRVISLSHGLIGQFGPILAGLLLSGFAMLGGVLRWTGVFIILAGITLVISWHQIRQYSRELIRLLENQNFDLFKAATEGVNNVEPEVFVFLEQNLASPSITSATMSAQFLASIRKSESLPLLCRVFPQADPRLRTTILQLFGSIGECRPEISFAIRDGLGDTNPAVQREALIALSILSENEFEPEILLPLLASGSASTAALAAVVLFNRDRDDTMWRNEVKDLLRRQLTYDGSSASSSAVDALAYLRQQDPELITCMITLFDAPMPLPRRAALTLQQVAANLGPLTLSPDTHSLLKSHLGHPVREVRLAAYQLLAAADAMDEARLIDGLIDNSEKIRSWTRGHARKLNLLDGEKLRSLALETNRLFLWESALLLQAELLDGKNDVAILALIEVALVRAGGNLACLAHSEKHYDGEQHTLLRTLLKDRLRLTVGTAIRLMEHLSDIKIAALLRKSFQSRDQRLRACALEALEQVKIEGIKGIIYLLEPFLLDLPSDEQLKLFEGVHHSEIPSPEKLLGMLQDSPDDWERAIVRNSLGVCRP